MYFRHKGVSEIMAARKRQIVWKQNHHKDQNVQASSRFNPWETKLEAFSKKQKLGNDQKLDMLNQLERKYRIAFTPRFPSHLITWVSVQDKKMIQKPFDCYRKSYYILKGEVTVFRGQQSKEQILENETGIGLVFGDSNFHNTQIYAKNATLLMISHSAEHLLAIQRDLLMTKKQKQQAAKAFKIFDELENPQKHYFPYFQAIKYTKGDYIYERGDPASQLFLLIQGEVSFEIQVELNSPKSKTISLVELIRQKKKDYFQFTSQVITKGSYFGEEQVINECDRLHNAKCNSLTCLLLVVPADKVEKMLSNQKFCEHLEISSRQKKLQLSRKIQKMVKMKQQSLVQIQSGEQFEKFESFKAKMLSNLSPDEQKPEQTKKITLRRSKHKIMHGYSVKMNRKSIDTEPAPYSMLQVNEKTYSKTIKRYRHSLQQLKRITTPKEKVEYGQGRSLVKVWNLLKLQQVFDPEKMTPFVKIMNSDCDGKASFQSHSRLTKYVKNRHNTRPKAYSSGCKVKQQYIKYLQQMN